MPSFMLKYAFFSGNGMIFKLKIFFMLTTEPKKEKHKIFGRGEKITFSVFYGSF